MDLQAATPQASAEVIRSVIGGDDGPALRIVLANAAAALLAAERVGNLKDGVAPLAREAIGTGRAAQVLDKLVRSTQAN